MSGEMEIGPIIVLIVILAVYIIPTVVAFSRGHPNRWPILIVNVAFGATFVGWLVALVWAAHAIHRPADVAASRGGESGLNLTVNDPVRLLHQAAGTPTPELSIAETVERLQKLDDLFARQAITPAEFSTLKAKLLGAM